MCTDIAITGCLHPTRHCATKPKFRFAAVCRHSPTTYIPSASGRVLPFAGLRLTVRFRGKPAARLPGRGSPVSITTTFTEHIRGFWRRDSAVHFQNYLMARV